MKLVWSLVIVGFVLIAALPISAGGGGAIITDIPGCGLYDGNGVKTNANTSTHIVQSPDGSIVLVCKADVTPSSTGHAVQWNAMTAPVANPPALCGAGVVDRNTTTWTETVSASGKATMVCNFPPTT